MVLHACSNNPSVAKVKPIIIPFEITSHNNMSIKAFLNHSDTLNLMFHTAASDLSLTTEATKSLESITWSGE